MEALAADFLLLQGLSVLKRNFRCKLGEIDLICREGETLVFVEVRSRSHPLYGGPLASLDRRKQTRIIRAAYCFLADYAWARGLTCRFDFIAIATDVKPPWIEWIPSAFQIQ